MKLEHVDAIVVLGHRPPLDERGVEYETRARVEHGVALYHNHRGTTLLMAGGPSTPSAIEADVMAEYAVSLGVPEQDIVRERKSLDTIENARLSVALLKERTGHVSAPRVLLVTSDYHIKRASNLFRCAGAEVEEAPVSLALPRHERAAKRIREWFVRVAYLFVDECARARGE